MGKTLLVLAAALVSHQCHGARIIKSGGNMTDDDSTGTSQNQCVITTREKELGLVWKFGIGGRGCRTSCLAKGIYSAKDRDAAFQSAFTASFENNRCHCRDKQGVDKLPLFRSEKYCTAKTCWEFYERLLGLYKKTNVYEPAAKCETCDEAAGQPCDDVNLGPGVTLPDLKKKKQDGTLPPGADKVINQFVDEEETTTLKPNVEEPVSPEPTENIASKCPGEYYGHDPKSDSCMDEETEEEAPEECCSAQHDETEEQIPTTERELDCKGQWSEFSVCSATCGDGEQMRKYHVTRAKLGGGNDCPAVDGAIETKSCNLQQDCCPAKTWTDDKGDCIDQSADDWWKDYKKVAKGCCVQNTKLG